MVNLNCRDVTGPRVITAQSRRPPGLSFKSSQDTTWHTTGCASEERWTAYMFELGSFCFQLGTEYDSLLSERHDDAELASSPLRSRDIASASGKLTIVAAKQCRRPQR